MPSRRQVPLKTPSRQPLARDPLALALAEGLQNRRSTSGFGLLEIIAVSALGAIVAAVGFTVYRQDQQAQQVATSVQSTQALGKAIQSSYSSSADYTGLNQQSALRENLFAPSLLNAAGQPQNVWGGSIQVAPTSIGTHPAFAITYDQVPQSSCTRLATQAAANFTDVQVNGQTILNSGRPNTAAAINLCAQSNSNTVQFIQAKQSLLLRNNPKLAQCTVQPNQTQQVACPSGQISSVPPYSVNGITQTRSSFCNLTYGTLGWTPWTNAASTCAPICVAPSASNTSQTQGASCPSGQVTSSGASSFTQTRTATTTYTCPAPTGSYTANTPTYSAWSPTPGSVCAPACSAPAPTTATQTQTSACPSGQVTSSGASSFTQTRTATTSYTCSSPTGSPTSSLSYSAWSPAASSVCSGACSAPAPSSTTQYQWVTVNAGCPSGYTGSHTYQEQQQRTATTTYSCPSPTGSYTTNPTTYSGWTNTGATQNDSNTCVAPPPPPPPTVTYNSTNIMLYRASTLDANVTCNGASYCSGNNGTYSGGATYGTLDGTFSVSCGSVTQTVTISCSNPVQNGSNNMNCTGAPVAVGACTCIPSSTGTGSPYVVAGTASISCTP